MALETKPMKPAANEYEAPVSRRPAEPPQAFYARITQREDIRRLLAKLAKL